MPRSPSIVFAEVIHRADLEALLTADLGPARMVGGIPHWRCPWHEDENPSLYLFDDGRRWRCWPCDKKGDALDWLVKREGITLGEAARRLDGGSISPAGAKTKLRPPVSRPAPENRLAAWQYPAWQSAVDRVVREAEDALWSPPGRQALDCLRGRGLEDQTISRFRLGYVARDYNTDPLEVLGVDQQGRPRGLWVRRGVTIPWNRPGSWYSTQDDHDGDPGPRWVGCNLRRLPSGDLTGDLDPKYWALQGSERGHGYPWPDATAQGMSVLVTEGEFDALIAWQEVGHLVNVVTFGGVGQAISAEARQYLDALPRWLLAFDNDRNHAGSKAALKLRDLNPNKARIGFLKGANDLNGLHRSGESIGDWLRSEFARLGWR